MTMTLREAAERRAAGVAQRSHRPSQRRSRESEDAPRQYARMDMTSAVPEIRAKGDTSETHVVGMASVTDCGYDMWDEYGPYTEEVDLGAFDNTLASNPSVEFTLNHNRGGGAPMAATWNDTLTLAAIKEGDVTGLAYDANVDASRNDVGDMVKALKRRDLREASFKFGIVSGRWSEDWSTYRILEVDLNGGDATAANFGANPSATSALREKPTKPGSELVTERDLARPMQSLV